MSILLPVEDELRAVTAAGRVGAGRRWPISPDRSRKTVGQGVLTALRAAFSFAQSEERAAALLAIARIEPFSRPLVLAALAGQDGTSLAENPYNFVPEVHAIYGETCRGETANDQPFFDPPSAWLRRIVRAASWSSPLRLPKAIFVPDAVAISHNPVLSRAARRSDLTIGFTHAESLLSRGRAAAAGIPQVDEADIGARLAEALIPDELRDPWRARLRDALLANARHHVRVALRDIKGLLALPDLPRNCWSGTGGYYPSRAVGLAVLVRGGQVLRFAHGGALSLFDIGPSVGCAEYAVSSEVRFETPAAAHLARTAAQSYFDAVGHSVVIDGADGDPFMVLPRRGCRAIASCQRVAYAPTRFFGANVPPMPAPPDAVYLDFQIRVVSALARPETEIVVQAHPEGPLGGGAHPLGRHARLTGTRFEHVVDEADVFVFDYPCSTTFAQALCSDKPVVLLDIWGEISRHPLLREEFRKRCRFVPVVPNAEGRMIFDPYALGAAVNDGPREVDGSFWRGILGGEAASPVALPRAAKFRRFLQRRSP